MNIAICVIAKDEEDAIGNLIEQISAQTIFNVARITEILVIANGCNDRTVEIAQSTFSNIKWPDGVNIFVHDLNEAGKARSWNLAVHNIISNSANIVIFVDADIELASDYVFENLLAELALNEDAVAISGWPIKNISRKDRKSLLDKFSLKVSSQTQYSHSINGSLYAAKMSCLRSIWMPVPIPGEDGMLSAMIKTNGFTRPPCQTLICCSKSPTHFFEAHTVDGFFRHEQRMVVGTTINGWIFEYFWKAQHSSHIGETVRELNEFRPNWVNDLVAHKVAKKRWVLPMRLLTWRLHNLRDVSPREAVGRAPFSIIATLLNVWPCIRANQTLRKRAAANFW